MAGFEIDIVEAVRDSAAQHPGGRSPEAEAQLVELLIDVGKARCEHSAAEKVAQPIASDLFRGTNGLPEICADELNPDTLAAGILYHGALLVRELYSSEHLERLQQLAATQEDTDRENNLPLGCSPHTFFELLEIYQNSGLLDAVRGYLDGEPVIFAERTKLRQHRAERDKYAAIPWHQDVNFFGRKSYAINCWAAVTDCGDSNPGLDIVPRRIKDRLGWNVDDGIAPLDYGRAISPETLEKLCGDRPIAHPVLQPGDALLFDEMTVHQTALKRWNQATQVVTISWFFRASGFPDWGTPLAI